MVDDNYLSLSDNFLLDRDLNLLQITNLLWKLKHTIKYKTRNKNNQKKKIALNNIKIMKNY